MNDLQTNVNSSNPTNVTGNACDNNINLLLVTLFEQHSKEDQSPEMKEQDEKKQSPVCAVPPFDPMKKLNLDFNMWHSVGPIKTTANQIEDEVLHRAHSEQFLAEKVKLVCELFPRLKSEDKETLSEKLVAMSSSSEICSVMRQSGVLPLLLHLIHEDRSSKTVRQQASKALHSIVQHNFDDKLRHREAHVLNLIEEISNYCEKRGSVEKNLALVESPDLNIPVSALMKCSFDADYRIAMVQLGALHTLAKLIQVDHERHKENVENLNSASVRMRRYACMTLTNLTFGDSTNKTLLCSLRPFMLALVAQLNSRNEDLCQDTASVLRNLSWKGSDFTKQTLSEIKAVTMLMKVALRVKKELTLKAVLSALWNLSAHSHSNKIEICSVEGAIEYLVKMLNYQAPSGQSIVVENISGILRNVSSIIAIRDDYRAIIREYNCLYTLLQHLKSSQVTVVSNACGTLWNLTARCTEDQCTLIQLGAVNMLRPLTHSNHQAISLASAAALRNLMSCQTSPTTAVINDVHSGTLILRKQRAAELEMDIRLTDTSGPTEPDVSTNCECMSRVISEQKIKDMTNNEFNSACSNVDVDSKQTDDASVSCVANSARYNLIFDKEDGRVKTKNSTSENCRNLTCEKDEILNKSEVQLKMKLSNYNFEKFREVDDTESEKMNGYRKIEEPYNLDDTFGDYTETDLDQTTNYSLRFSEQGSDLRSNSDVEQSDLAVSHNVNDTLSEKKIVAGEHASFETPLMFSRSSSLGSVSTCSDHVADSGSIVSEFSHAVSGVISPSELPDSPTQTEPPSPHPVSKKVSTFYEGSKLRVLTRNSVFEDAVQVFKEESTPIQFSVATSLSSLTFDDESHLIEELTPIIELPTSLGTSKKDLETNVSDGKSGDTRNSDDTVVIFCEEGDDSLDVKLSFDEQQAMLKACIDSGKFGSQKSSKISAGMMKVSQVSQNEDRSRSISVPVLTDTTINYCTEDTPISISHAASNSDLSLLCPSEDSFLQNSILPLSSCAEDHDVIELPTEEQEKMLNFCIAKGVQSLSYHSNNSFDDGKSSVSSTLSEITEDLPVEDRTLLKDMDESLNLMPNTVTMSSSVENDYAFLDDMVNKELSEEDTNLLNRAIVMGVRSMKESSDLENIGPPSFLAEANLDSSLTNVEEITDYPPTTKNIGKFTVKHCSHQIKDRYQTYTVKQMSPTTNAQKDETEQRLKPASIKQQQRRFTDTDRFKTRTLSKGDFDEFVRFQEKSKPPQSPMQNELGESGGTTSDGESYHETAKPKIVKPVAKAVKSGIPVVRSKLPTVKSSATMKKSNLSELPINLQRQNTFTKDEPSTTRVKHTVKSKQKSIISVENISQFRSGIPSRIKEPSPKGARVNDLTKNRSPDIAKNRWSISENNLNSANSIKTTSNTSLNISSAYNTSRISPSTSQSALPIRKESSSRACGCLGYKK